jgi:hypothetical protein
VPFPPRWRVSCVLAVDHTSAARTMPSTSGPTRRFLIALRRKSVRIRDFAHAFEATKPPHYRSPRCRPCGGSSAPRVPRPRRRGGIRSGCRRCRTQDAPAPAPLRSGAALASSLLDGSPRAPGRPGDLAIRDGRIAATRRRSTCPLARRCSYLDGLVVAPGFVDVHVHVDAEHRPAARRRELPAHGRDHARDRQLRQLGREPAAPTSPGSRRGGIGVNYASLVGHGTVRRAVLGTENRAPTTAELARMQELVEQRRCARVRSACRPA